MQQCKCQLIQSDDVDDGWTCYFGGKFSALRLRVYDRRGPLRLEFQYRPHKQMGHQLPDLLLQVDGPGEMWRTLARKVEFKVPWYQRLLVGHCRELTIDARTESTFLEALEHLRKQFGVTLWAALVAGYDLDDLVRDPERLRGQEAAKLLSWARQCDRIGYDGAALKREVKDRWQR
jgi:hypothetical protein